MPSSGLLRDALAALEAREAELADEISKLTAETKARTAELGNVRAAIAPLRLLESGAASQRTRASQGTYAALRAYIATLGPDTRIQVDAAVAHAEANGWHSPGMDGRSAMLMALSKLAGLGEIQHPATKHYRTNRPGRGHA